jgi:hypothetical protein
VDAWRVTLEYPAALEGGGARVVTRDVEADEAWRAVQVAAAVTPTLQEPCAAHATRRDP